MKKLLLVFVLLFSVSAFAQKKITDKVVDAGCAMCMFKEKSANGCAMAVKLNNKVYPVEGIDKKHFGPMHADNGYCKVFRKAKVTGEIRKGKFHAKSFTYVN